MAYGSVDSRFVIFPAGPADAEALASAHVTSWRETYRGLLPDAYLARMSEIAHARRFAHLLLRPGPDDVTLAAADRWGIVGYAQVLVEVAHAEEHQRVGLAGLGLEVLGHHRRGAGRVGRLGGDLGVHRAGDAKGRDRVPHPLAPRRESAKLWIDGLRQR